MLSREQIYTMLILRNRQGTLFSVLPMELVQGISDYGQDPNSEVAKALHYAAYARQEDVDALLAMLETNPSLLLYAGNVKTPGGDEVRRVTIYEFLLGAGDYELAEKVQGYFVEIENGEQERLRQYERYKPHIDGMLSQKPYDLSSLIELIKKASPEEIKALLNKETTDKTELGRAMLQFRKDWAPRVILKPGMHYNYTSLKHAFELLYNEWSNLYKASGNSYDKIDLVWRQLIGFEMRRLPGIDRCIMAQGLYYVIDQHKPLARTYQFTYQFKNESGVEFPVTDSDDSLDGLGDEFAVNVHGGRAGAAAGSQCRQACVLFCRFWTTYVEQKLQTCKTYAAKPSPSIELVCNTLS